MKENIILKRATAEDSEMLAELRINQIMEEDKTLGQITSEYLSNFYREEIIKGNIIIIKAVLNNKIIATGGLSVLIKPPYAKNPSGRVGMISNMYTLPEYRKRGIAKKILEFAKNRAKDLNCGTLHVSSSKAGIFLYESFGFEKHPRYFKYDIK